MWQQQEITRIEKFTGIFFFFVANEIFLNFFLVAKQKDRERERESVGEKERERV